MGRRYNELYIGDQFLTIEGREIKHVGLLKEFGNTNVNKITNKQMQLYGLDIETDYKTAEMKLLGVWDGKKYRKHYNTKFVAALFNLIDKLFWESKKGEQLPHALVYWNKLDPFVLYKQFLLMFEDKYQKYSMKRYGKISGEWSKSDGEWKVKPVIEVSVKRGLKYFKFGIKNVIRSSIQFFYYEVIDGSPKQFDNGLYPINTIWAYDVAPLYKYGLEKEMLARAALFPYYSKVSKEAHLVDWVRYEKDHKYRKNIVDRSNELDARAVYDLGMLVVNDFYRSFHYYPRNLISAGSLARAAITARLKYKFSQLYDDENAVNTLVDNELKAIALINHYDVWYKQIGGESLKDMFCLFYESYSGGYIEAIQYGMIGKGYYSDIASAYIKYITELLDLRGSKVTNGKGIPPHIDNSYCFIRGTVTIPLDCDYLPITVKHITNKDTNVRATGTYRASYTLDERDYMLSQGAKFSNETWYNIETLGNKSPIANVALDLTDIRYKQKASNDTAEYLTKTVTASIYGITFEATNTFYESDDLEVYRGGYRGGEFLNPLYAAWITAKTRIQISSAAQCIANNGGKPALLMTDCVFWEGSKTDLDASFIRDKKTLGYFETPKEFKQMASLGTGRYSYIDAKKGYITTKNRGLNIFDLHDPDGVQLDSFNWIEALKVANRKNTLEIFVKVRLLVSVGMALHTKELKTLDKNGKEKIIPISVDDLGKVMTVYRKVDLLTGKTKRIMPETPSIQSLATGSIKTESIYYGVGMDGTNNIVDQTLPQLRDEVMKMKVQTARKRDLNNRSKASYKYNLKNKDDILKNERDKYQYIKKHGFDRDTAKKWCKRSIDRIDKELLKIKE